MIPIENLTLEQARNAAEAIKTIKLVTQALAERVPYNYEGAITGGRVYGVDGFQNDVRTIEAALDELKVLAGLKIIVE